MKQNILSLLSGSIKNFVLKPICFRKLCHSSEMQNDDLMHREGLTFSARGPSLYVKSDAVEVRF